jgi:uncharacterized protein (UPF0276 family)
VFDLVADLCAIATPPGVMIERDDAFPPEPELLGELDALAGAVRRGAARREGARVA